MRKISLLLYAPFAFSGILSTLLLPETKNTTLEDNSNEEQFNFVLGKLYWLPYHITPLTSAYLAFRPC